ncbi:MAG: F0F1 ATP synthase subunit A [Acidimicrobiia bacterium]|nr:F0F1 ATP synthase subunit A [Acidimicrobiia bacterium]
MERLILAASECDPEEQIICTPDSVNDLFELPFFFGDSLNRTMWLTLFAGLLVVAFFYFAFRRKSLVPSKFQALGEMAMGFVRDEIAIGIVGREHGLKYFPYLASIFFFILIGNLFEVVPFILFPVTSRIGLPIFLALITWFIFLIAGIRAQGFGGYFGHLVWPPGVPTALKPLVGAIELVSVILVRPFSLAVRLFANLAAGHVMLSLLLLSAWVFLAALPTGNLAGLWGLLWAGLGLFIYLFEILVAILQAYIFTLLSAVYIQTSVEVEAH